jgi:hypothetical protein
LALQVVPEPTPVVQEDRQYLAQFLLVVAVAVMLMAQAQPRLVVGLERAEI